MYTVQVLAFLLIASGSEVLSFRIQSEKDALAYLTYYGYVDPNEMPTGFTLNDCNKKLKDFQKMARVEITGILDNSTIKAMNSPRCGCPDFISLSFTNNYEKNSRNKTETHSHHEHDHSHDHSHNHRRPFRRSRSHRHKRFVLSQRQWEKRVLTYSIVKYPTRYGLKITTSQIDEAIQRAFHIWQEHINLRFQFRPNDVDVDIELSFASTYHGDSYPFDGPGKTLAHAFFPGSGIGGDVHFEEEEDWTLGTYGGVDLLYVAVHELGHSLGLGHSADYGAIMYPMYRGYLPNLQLHSDDIQGIQKMYGQSFQTTSTTAKPKSTTTRRTVPTTTLPSKATTTRRYYRNSTSTKPTHPPHDESNHDLCENPAVDGITTMFDSTILVFQGMKVYEIGRNGEGVRSGWPVDINRYFNGLEGNLDYVITRTNGRSYFFKGTKYWRFTGKKMDRGYPRLISEHFPGIPNDLDAAFEWDDEFVFVKGDKFWRFNTRKRPHVQPFFPMPTSHWGVSGEINAAFTATNGTIYFFQGHTYWEFNKSSHQVIKKPYTVQLSSEDWFGCLEP